MRKLVLYCALGGVFGLAVLLETLVTNRPADRPANRLVLTLGTGPRTVPETPPDTVRARTREREPPPGPGRRNGDGGTRGADDPTQEPEPPAQPDTYEVQPNDTFWDIAAQTLGSATEWKRLASYNGLEPDGLRAGMTLKIPPRSNRSTTPDPETQPPETGRTHTLKAGETLGDVAQQYLGSARRWKEIQELNGIQDPLKVPAGKVLKIPDA